jgi:hypothetical protein
VTITPHRDQLPATIAIRRAIALLLASVLFPLACSSASAGKADVAAPDASADAGPDLLDRDGPTGAFETAGACVSSAISEAEATRKSSAASVSVDAVLLNAVDGCPRDDVRFKLVLDTHSVSLLAFDLAASARLESSSGATISSGFRWMGTSGSDHHREGVLSVTAANLSGAGPLRLTMQGIAGVDRTFEWDASFLGWARRP